MHSIQLFERGNRTFELMSAMGRLFVNVGGIKFELFGLPTALISMCRNHIDLSIDVKYGETIPSSLSEILNPLGHSITMGIRTAHHWPEGYKEGFVELGASVPTGEVGRFRDGNVELRESELEMILTFLEQYWHGTYIAKVFRCRDDYFALHLVPGSIVFELNEIACPITEPFQFIEAANAYLSNSAESESIHFNLSKRFSDAPYRGIIETSYGNREFVRFAIQDSGLEAAKLWRSSIKLRKTELNWLAVFMTQYFTV